MPQISLRENDSLEYSLKKLKRACDKANIWSVVREKAAGYLKPTTVRKRAKKAAVKRQKKKNSMERIHTNRKSRPAYYNELRSMVDKDHSDQS